MDGIICDKVYQDFDNASGPLPERQFIHFSQFIYDSMLMKFGLLNLMVKTLMQLVNGLKNLDNSLAFGF
jgi:hypothetical protein